MTKEEMKASGQWSMVGSQGGHRVQVAGVTAKSHRGVDLGPLHRRGTENMNHVAPIHDSAIDILTY